MVKRLEFYDVGTKERFSTSKYDIRSRIVNGNTRKYAVARSKTDRYDVWKVLPKDFKK